MDFLYCILYLMVSGLTIFFIGRVFPRKWIHESSFPFKSYKWENDGQIYRKIGVHKWKTKLPDASVLIHKIAPWFMPKKRLDAKTKDKMKTLVKESCVAEFNHFMAAVLGLYCMKIWRKTGGIILSICNFICHMPFVLIQRYNRPRLVKSISRFDNLPETAME